MAQFYFDLYDDLVTLDEEGADLPDVNAARERAIESIRDLICREVKTGVVDLRSRIEVFGEGRNPLFTVGYADALELRY
jgi:hypothetical protein